MEIIRQYVYTSSVEKELIFQCNSLKKNLQIIKVYLLDMCKSHSTKMYLQNLLMTETRLWGIDPRH